MIKESFRLLDGSEHVVKQTRSGAVVVYNREGRMYSFKNRTLLYNFIDELIKVIPPVRRGK